MLRLRPRPLCLAVAAVAAAASTTTVLASSFDPSRFYRRRAAAAAAPPRSLDVRGGGGSSARTTSAAKKKSDRNDAYSLLADAILDLLPSVDADDGDGGYSARPPPPDVGKVAAALESLSSAQAALKGLDGAAHEAYQRTHRTSSSSTTDGSDGGGGGVDTVGEGVTGRAMRSASRAGCAADALFAAELCELLEVPGLLEEELEARRRRRRRASSVGGAEEDEEEAAEEEEEGGTLDGREVILNVTNLTVRDSSGGGRTLPLSVLALREPDYGGGAGLDHGGIDGMMLDRTRGGNGEAGLRRRGHRPRGRILVIVCDGLSSDLRGTTEVLASSPPRAVGLHAGLVANEAASVNDVIWRAAGEVLRAVGPALVSPSGGVVGGAGSDDDDADGGGAEGERRGTDDDEEEGDRPLLPAIHFVGRSLGGGIAAIASAILDGSLPMPDEDAEARGRSEGRGKKRRSHGKARKKRRKRHGSGSGATDVPSREAEEEDDDDAKSAGEESATGKDGDDDEPPAAATLEGYGRGRSSAVALGPPPCLSPNVRAAFVTSVIHGDDVVCRTTQESVQRLCQRTNRALGGNFLGRKVGWMADAVSLTVSSLKSHAHGSEGEECRLAVPGKTYLIRPRRYHGTSSLHEVGGGGGGGSAGGGSGREGLRAAVLFQLNDVLLSKSLWSHHGLDAYIGGLDRVQLRGFAGGEDEGATNRESAED